MDNFSAFCVVTYTILRSAFNILGSYPITLAKQPIEIKRIRDAYLNRNLLDQIVARCQHLMGFIQANLV